MVTLPTIKTLAPNFTVFTLGNTRVWFSYETAIAFEVKYSDGSVASARRENIWGPNTGKHINSIDLPDAKSLNEQDFADDFYTQVGSLG